MKKKLRSLYKLGAKHGCPPDQLLNYSNAGIILQDRQLAASVARPLVRSPHKSKLLEPG